MNNLLMNRYKLLKLIGKGGMADVYLALDTILNREVAIKILKSDLTGDLYSVERFKREAFAVSKLMHPNIVEIYDVGEQDNHYFIVMEYVSGSTLKKLIQKRGKLDKKEAIFIMKQLSSALCHAHSENIIHRDIKPQNVIVKDDGTVKILDFGIALASDAMQLTANNTVLGSVHYLAPELSKGSYASIQSDIYALGVVFYELLSGTVPYKAQTPIDVAIKHLNEPFPKIRDIDKTIPKELEDVILKCCAKEKINRYKDLSELLGDLEMNKKNSKKNSKKKKVDRSSAYIFIYITVITIISIVLIIFTLILSGVLRFGTKYVAVPDIQNYDVLEAQELLQLEGLSIDLNNIKRELTDNIDQGKIISFVPEAGSEVEKGSKVVITVSEGKYAVMKDYVGKNIKEVRQEIENVYKYVTIKTEVDNTSAKESGTILKQELLLPNDKFNPNEIKEIKFTYVPYPSIMIPHNIKNSKYNDAKFFFEEKGLKVELIKVDRSQLSEEDSKKYINGDIIEINPSEGTIYTQEDNNKIIIKYFEE